MTTPTSGKLAITLLVAVFFRTVASAAVAIVPQPQSVVEHPGQFVLSSDTVIVADHGAKAEARYLADRLAPATGWRLPVQTFGWFAPQRIVLSLDAKPAEVGTEGYLLSVTPQRVTLRAARPAGIFYGIQTLRQLLPPQIERQQPVPMRGDLAWTVPCLDIKDQPRFVWRGLMLDVSRHFFNKAEIKQLLDAMALHKLNTFHWHLVDDNGWRIEIKKYPRLTQVGAWRKDIGFGLNPQASTAYGSDGRYGGFYTQADIREIVAYAAAQHITIVPEIEMPGHSGAALSAYPEFSCAGGGFSTDMGAGIHASVYCAGKDATFAFLQDVLTEVFALFPGKYIHIGGDEVTKENWKKCALCQARKQQEGLQNEHEIQSYFIRRMEKFINAHGRNLIGWSEIREGGLAQNAAVMDWIGGAVEAAGAGHDVVMSPTKYCYFDYYQSTNRLTEPRAIGGFLPLAKVYALEPVPAELAPTLHHHILGAQGNLWTEYIPSLQHAEYMIFPRLSALAEVVWTTPDKKDYADFYIRLHALLPRLDMLGVKYRQPDQEK